MNRRTQTRARKALDKIDKMIAEITRWQGKAPQLVRVCHADYLALVEAEQLVDGKLKGRELEVRPG